MPNPKKILKAVVAGKKAAQRRQTNKIQKNSVKVKPAANKINTELPKKNKFAKRSALHNEFKSNVDTTGMTPAQKRYAKNKYFIEKMNKGR